MHFLIPITAFILLAACGFQPVYGPKGGNHVAAPMHYIAVDDIPSRAGQILQIALEDGLHPQGDAPKHSYRLAVQLEETRQPIIIERTGRVTRYNLIHTAKFRVYDPRGGQDMHKSNAKRISSYNVAPSDFSTFVGERDARERGLKELAQDILMQLAAAFAPEKN